MLAPLKNRDILERDPADPQSDLAAPATPENRQVARMAAEIAALREALRQTRRTQRRNATATARQIVGQLNEINRLQTQNAALRQRLADLESGRAIIDLGRRLLQLSESNEQLSTTAQRVWFLEKTIAAAHAEYQRLSDERDALLFRLETPAGRG